MEWVVWVVVAAIVVGVALAGAAYVPQIWHLVRVHCSAGISRFAFGLWLAASLLVTAHAIATGAVAFILLGGVQVVATTVILVYATKYAFSYCVGHAPVGFGAKTDGSTSMEDGGVLGTAIPTASTNRAGGLLSRAGEQPDRRPGASFENGSPC
jgi:PQ loop repeat